MGVPARSLGTCVTTKDAFWRCTGQVNVSGTVLQQELQGQANNHADCTGNIVYNQQINGAPAGQLDINPHATGAFGEKRTVAVGGKIAAARRNMLSIATVDDLNHQWIDGNCLGSAQAHSRHRSPALLNCKARSGALACWIQCLRP